MHINNNNTQSNTSTMFKIPFAMVIDRNRVKKRDI